jgi:hypothetical protein
LLSKFEKIVERLEENPRNGNFSFVNRLVAGEERGQVWLGKKILSNLLNL